MMIIRFLIDGHGSWIDRLQLAIHARIFVCVVYISTCIYPCTLASTESGIWMHILAWQGPTSNKHYFRVHRQNSTKGGGVGSFVLRGGVSLRGKRIQNAGLRIFTDSTLYMYTRGNDKIHQLFKLHTAGRGNPGSLHACMIHQIFKSPSPPPN